MKISIQCAIHNLIKQRNCSNFRYDLSYLSRLLSPIAWNTNFNFVVLAYAIIEL